MSNEASPAKTSIKTILIGLILFAAVMFLVMFFVFRNVHPKDIAHAIRAVNPGWIIGGFGLMVIYAIGEGLNLRRPLRMLGYHTTFWQGFKYSVVGFFFSSITPSSTGGQPMVFYYMHEDGVKSSHAILAVLMQLFGYLSATVALALVGYRVMNPLLTRAMPKTKHLLLIGIILFLLFLLFVSVCLFSKIGIRIIVKVLTKIIQFFNRKGNGKVAGKIQKVVDDYGGLAGSFDGHLDVIWKTWLTSFIQFVCMFSVPFLIYRGFGLSDYGYFQILLLQAVIYSSVGFVPIPGAAGATEGVFMLLFRQIYPQHLLASGMLLSRFVSLYLCVIVDGVLVFFISRRLLRRKARQKLKNNVQVSIRQNSGMEVVMAEEKKTQKKKGHRAKKTSRKKQGH